MINLNKTLSKLLRLDINYLLKGGGWLLLSYGVSLITGVTIAFFYGNYLPTLIVGQYSFVSSIITGLSLFTLIGMGQALTHSFVHQKFGNFEKAFIQTLKFSIVGSIISFGIAVYFLFNQQFEVSYSLFFLAIVFPLSAVSNYYQSFYIANKDFKTISLVNSLCFLANMSFVILVILQNGGLLALVIASSLPTLIIHLGMTLRVKKKVGQIDLSYLKLGWHLSLTQYINFLTKSVDKILIGLLLSYDQLAIYTFAILIPEQSYGLLKQVITLATPKISQLSNKEIKNSIATKFLYSTLIAVVTVTSYILISPVLFKILLPKYLSDSLVLSQIYSLTLITIPTNLLTLVFQRINKTRVFYYQEVSFLVILLISLFLLIPKYGVMGAVSAQIIARFFYMFLSLFLFNQYRRQI